MPNRQSDRAQQRIAVTLGDRAGAALRRSGWRHLAMLDAADRVAGCFGADAPSVSSPVDVRRAYVLQSANGQAIARAIAFAGTRPAIAVVANLLPTGSFVRMTMERGASGWIIRSGDRAGHPVTTCTLFARKATCAPLAAAQSGPPGRAARGAAARYNASF